LINCFESVGNLKFFGWWSDEDAELVEVVAHEDFGSEHTVRLLWRVIKIIWVNCKWSENISVSRPLQSIGIRVVEVSAVIIMSTQVMSMWSGESED
jgi:hypothetical protein